MKNFEFISREEKLDSEQTRRSLTYWQDVWRRLRKNKLSMIGLFSVIGIILFGSFGPMFIEGDYSDQILDYSNLPPRLDVYEIGDDRFVYIVNYNVFHIILNQDWKHIISRSKGTRKCIYEAFVRLFL